MARKGDDIRLLMGAFTPTVQPLWCRYVWNNEIVNGTYEQLGFLN